MLDWGLVPQWVWVTVTLNCFLGFPTMENGNSSDEKGHKEGDSSYILLGSYLGCGICQLLS